MIVDYKERTIRARVATIPVILVVVADPDDDEEEEELQEGILFLISLLNTRQYSFVISNSSSLLSTSSICNRKDIKSCQDLLIISATT